MIMAVQKRCGSGLKNPARILFPIRSNGFTLVEIAIVLVIIGLLLGGVLKGQELINNAKVRSIADRQISMKVAWFAFLDRFAALPGDSPLAPRYIPNLADTALGNGDAEVQFEESVLAFAHLTQAGYLRCGICTAAETGPPQADNSLVNSYGGLMTIFTDGQFYSEPGGIKGSRHATHTGPRIPSNILAEVDRKIDDGIANAGDMRFNSVDPYADGKTTTTTGSAVNCMRKFDGGGLVGTKAPINDLSVLEWRAGGGADGGAFPDCQASIFI